MRLVAFVYILFLCVVLAEDIYVDKYFAVDRVPNDPSKRSNIQIIKYTIKKPANFPKNGPVFYGTAGRVPVESIQSQLNLFDKVYPDFDQAAVVYVEQRFFGESSLQEERIRSLADLADLKLEYVINDHIELIKFLSLELDTKNFLVFGAGHGGLITGYIAERFATVKDLRDNYNVLGWSSSPPVKYLRQGNDFKGAEFQELNKQFATLLRNGGGCDTGAIAQFSRFFKLIRDLTNTDANRNLLNTFNIDPKPVLKNAAGDETSDDIKAFLVYLRNSIRDLSYDNRLYKTDGSKDADPILRKLCTIMRRVQSPLTATMVNDVLALFSTDTNPRKWKIRIAGDWNKDLALPMYQDCTDLQIVSCPKNTADATDPFTWTQWNERITCDSQFNFDLQIREECQGLFGLDMAPTDHIVSDVDFPRSFKNRVVTTINKQSMFYGSYSKFKDDKNPDNYAYNWDVFGVDNQEIEAPRICDTDKTKDVRYLTLRAFGCLGGFIDKSVCNNLFDDNVGGNEYDDSTPGAATCLLDTTENGKFPWSHDAVKFVDPDAPVQATTMTSPPVTDKTSEKTTPKSGSGSMLSLMSVMFVWLSASLLLVH